MPCVPFALLLLPAVVARAPNILFVLADGGLEFVNHVAVVPVCGPSRTSLLAGRYPHNVGYVANARAPSVAAWSKLQNDTLGRWMQRAGYHTAFLGKYINGMECDVPAGWHHWGGLTCTRLHGERLGGTYNYLNASQWRANFDDAGMLLGEKQVKIWGNVHQTAYLGEQTLEQVEIAVAKRRPFFVHVTPLTVHGGTCEGPQPEEKYAFWDPYWERYNYDPTPVGPYGEGKGTVLTGSPCPTRTHAWSYNALRNPHLPSWAAFANGTVPKHIAAEGNPHGLHARGCCDAWEADRQDFVYRNRSAALPPRSRPATPARATPLAPAAAAARDLDDMLGVILKGLDKMRLSDSTFVFFSSDNGFHLGEHRMLFGKTKPYATDVRLPMYVAGPGLPRGETRPLPTTHLDITATIAELGGAAKHAPHPLDGLSFKAALGSTPPALSEWRDFSFSEFYVNDNTWRNIRLIDHATGQPAWAFHWWCSNQSEVYREADDPFQMANVGGDDPTPFGRSIVRRYLPATEVLGACVGGACNRMPPAGTPSANPLPCHDPGELLHVDEAWMD